MVITFSHAFVHMFHMFPPSTKNALFNFHLMPSLPSSGVKISIINLNFALIMHNKLFCVLLCEYIRTSCGESDIV